MEHARLIKAYEDAKANREYLADLIRNLRSELANAVESHIAANEAEQEAKTALLKFEKKTKEE